MSGRVRVLVVDDSAFTRKVISDMLGSDPNITVIDVARDGKAALEKARKLGPDVITMDVEMPVMDGLQALRAIMGEMPTPVIMLSALTQEGAQATIRALELGAVDFVPKPSSSVALGLGQLRDLLVEKVKLAAQARVRPLEIARRRVLEERTAERIPRAVRQKGTRVGAAPGAAVVVGSSTGGPSALNSVMSVLPADLPAGVMVVQHMPPGFTKSLAARLNDVSAIEVREAAAGDKVEPGVALVAPGGLHLVVADDRTVLLSSDPPRNGVRPSVDVTMESAAHVFGRRVVGVVLTGMGRDGAAGMAAIKASGGRTIAEHESTCVIYGMPRAVIDKGLADTVAPLHQVGDAIARIVQQTQQ